jgi:hypothetical protein
MRNGRVLASAVPALLVMGASLFSLPVARADEVIVPPAVPGDIQVPAGAKAFLEGHAFGTQNYICLPSGGGFAWSLFTPEATLFKDGDRQLTTHFFGANPEEKGTIRAAWQHSRDTSTVWAGLVRASTDAAFVAKDAIPWLLLEKKGTQVGPDGGDVLTHTTFVQRIHTVGGVAPATGCAGPADVGAKAFIPYEADYVFFTGP